MRHFWKDETAQDLLEYSLIALLIAVGAIAGMTSLAASINQLFHDVAGTLT